MHQDQRPARGQGRGGDVQVELDAAGLRQVGRQGRRAIHLGGFAAGYAFLRWRRRRYFAQWRPVETPKKALAKAAKKGNDVQVLGRWKSIRMEDLHELNRDEVARLLTKAEQEGVGALTPDERAMLDRFSTPH